MRRTLLGILAVALLIVGVVLLFTQNGNTSRTTFASGCLRIGAVLFALWLALPHAEQLLQRTPRWLIATLFAALAVVVLRPQLLLFVAPVTALLWFLAPRIKTRLRGGERRRFIRRRDDSAS